MASSVVKITLSLPIELVDHMTYLASSFGVSRSALAAQFLAEPVDYYYTGMGPKDLESKDLESKDSISYGHHAGEILKERIAEIENSTADLFTGRR